MRIAVAGGTGMVGRHVVDQVRAIGHEPVTLARSSGVDLVSGRGLDEAMAGVEVVIDVASVVTTRRAAAIEFFTTTTRNLLRAEERAGVRHHVMLSIVGIDHVTLGGYYEGKRRQEGAVAAGAVPWSALRATQFHEFAVQVLARASLGPVCLVPRMLVQPVAASEVAVALTSLALGQPVGRAPDLAGPQQEQLVDMVRRVVRAQAERRLVVPLLLPGRGARSAREGGLTPSTRGPRGSITFEQWLASSFQRSG